MKSYSEFCSSLFYLQFCEIKTFKSPIANKSYCIKPYSRQWKSFFSRLLLYIIQISGFLEKLWTIVTRKNHMLAELYIYIRSWKSRLATDFNSRHETSFEYWILILLYITVQLFSKYCNSFGHTRVLIHTYCHKPELFNEASLPRT